MKNFYKYSNLTFYTAIDEPYGLIPLESMLVGTPILAFDNAGPSETIKNGKTGYLIKCYDINDFAKKAVNLIKDTPLYKKFSENAKEHDRNYYNFEKSFSNLKHILEIISKN